LGSQAQNQPCASSSPRPNSRASLPDLFLVSQVAPSDRAGAHAQAKISIPGLDLSLVVVGVEFGVCAVWFAAEFRYYGLVF
jgi:hypothetical protein